MRKIVGIILLVVAVICFIWAGVIYFTPMAVGGSISLWGAYWAFFYRSWWVYLLMIFSAIAGIWFLCDD